MVTIRTDGISANVAKSIVLEPPLTVCNLWFRGGTRKVLEWSEDMTCVCFLSTVDSSGTHYRAELFELEDKSLDHRRGIRWDSGIINQQEMYICYDCLCLMVLC